MTISTSTRKAGPFVGSGSTGPFTFTFKVFQASDLLVVTLNTANGVETTLALTTDYTVSLNANQNTSPGGTVTLVNPLAVGFSMIISSQVAYTQETDLTNQGGFYPEVVTDSLDKATIQAQQIVEKQGRQLTFPITDPSTSLGEMPSYVDRAGKYLGFDSNGNPIPQGAIPDTIYYGPNATDPTLRKNGTALQAGDIYFNTALNELRVYSGVSWSVVTADGASIRTATATAGQLTFTVNGGYVPGKIQVFINGVLLSSGYTATNGTTITFSPALSLNDEIVVIVFKSLGALSFADIFDLTISNNDPSGSPADGAVWIKI